MIYFAAMSKLAIVLHIGTAHTPRIYSKTASPVPFTADLPPGGIPGILICMFRDGRQSLVAMMLTNMQLLAWIFVWNLSISCNLK